MNDIRTGERRDNLARSIGRWGRKVGREDWGSVYVLDGKAWLVDATRAECLGDYFEYLVAARVGRRPGFIPEGGGDAIHEHLGD